MSLNNLAALLQAEGDLAGARPLYERALAISKKVLGAEHRNTATSLPRHPACPGLWPRGVALVRYGMTGERGHRHHVRERRREDGPPYGRQQRPPGAGFDPFYRPGFTNDCTRRAA